MKLYSWGNNSHGQLGLETKKEEILIPTKANINIVVKQVIGGGTHTILLTDSNILVCGSNEKGQLGKELSVSTLFSFESILCPFKIVKVSCGWDFNLALTETLDVIGWGSNSFGQLGLPTDTFLKISSPRKIFEEKAVDIGAGLRHSVIISLKGVLLASGFGRKGQLGFYLNNVLPLKVENFTKVSSIDNFEKVSCGECHCVAATRNGQVYTWGNNKYGQLGIEPKGRASIIVPTPIKLSLGNIKVKEVHSGWAHNVILTEMGEVMSWGRNDFGQLGENRCPPWKPKFVKNLRKVQQVSLGSHHSVVLTELKEVFTWGWNEHGSCGNLSCENILRPQKIHENVKLVGSGAAHSFFCA